MPPVIIYRNARGRGTQTSCFFAAVELSQTFRLSNYYRIEYTTCHKALETISLRTQTNKGNQAQVEVSPLKIAKTFEVNLSKSVRFAFNAMNAVKKKFKAVINFFSMLNRWKEFFHRYQQKVVKKVFHRYQQKAVKKFSPLKSQIIQIFTANFNAYLKFTGYIKKVGVRWSSGLTRRWHAGGERFERV